MSGPLFEPDVPAGFVYRSAFLDVDEEFNLLNELRQISFSHLEMRSALIAARETVAGISVSHPDRLIYPDLSLSKVQLARYNETTAVTAS